MVVCGWSFAGSWSKAFNMFWSDTCRGWLRAGVCSLVWLSAFAFAQTTAAPPTSSSSSTAAQTSARSAAAAKHASSGHAATKPASTRTPTRTSGKSSGSSSAKSKSSHGKKSSKKVANKRGQQAIDPARAREIQTALIRQHYMQGEPSGTWDSATQAAMQRYQADQGWQSKEIPDSRALIKLGLGPSSDHLLNPESAMTTPVSPVTGGPKAGAKPAPSDNGVPQQ
jgi:hypothetical protein